MYFTTLYSIVKYFRAVNIESRHEKTAALSSATAGFFRGKGLISRPVQGLTRLPTAPREVRLESILSWAEGLD